MIEQFGLLTKELKKKEMVNRKKKERGKHISLVATLLALVIISMSLALVLNGSDNALTGAAIGLQEVAILDNSENLLEVRSDLGIQDKIGIQDEPTYYWYANEDAHVWSGGVSSNYETAENKVRNFNTAKMRSYVEWDPHNITIPEGYNITEVEVCMYKYIDGSGSDFLIVYNSTDFDQTTLTWANQPCGSSLPSAGCTQIVNSTATGTGTKCWSLGQFGEDAFNNNISVRLVFQAYPESGTEDIDGYRQTEYVTQSSHPQIRITAYNNFNPNGTGLSTNYNVYDYEETVYFDSVWSDPDANDNVKSYVCKDAGCTNCNSTNQSNCYCYSSDWNTDEADQCNVTLNISDLGTNNYWLDVCDDEGLCDNDTLISGSFEVKNLTVVNLTDLGDSTVLSDYPTSNDGSSTSLRIDSDSPQHRSYLSFNTSVIPANVSVERAEVCAYVNYLNTETDVNYYWVNGTFSESGITWNNQPCGTTFSTTICPYESVETLSAATPFWQCWSAVDMVNNSLNKGDHVYSVLRAANEGSGVNQLTFHSKENTYDPYLNFAYTLLDTPDPLECGNLSLAGTYTLTNNLTTNGTCFTIQADAVEIDCNGYSIEGDGESGDYGVDDAAGFDGTIIRNCEFLSFGTQIYINGDGDNGVIANNSFVGSGINGIHIDDGASWDVSHNNFTGNYTGGLYPGPIRFDTNSVNNRFWGNIFNEDKGFEFQDGSQANQIYCVNGYGNFYNSSVRVDANDEGVSPYDCGPSPGPNGVIYVNESLTEPIIDWGGNATYVLDLGTGVRNANSTVYMLTNNTLTSYYANFGILTARSNVEVDCQGFTLSPETPGSDSQRGIRVYDTNVNIHNCVFDRFDITIFVETNGAQANIYNNSFIAGSGVDIGIELDDGDNWNIYHNNFTGTYTEGLYSSAIRFDTNSVGNSFWGNIFNDDKGFDFQDPAQDSQDFCVNGYGNFYNVSVRVDENDEGVPPTDCGPSPGPNGVIYVNESLTEPIIDWGGNATYVLDLGTGVRNANSTVYMLTNNTLTSYYANFGILTARSNVEVDCQGFTLNPETPGSDSQRGIRVYDTNINIHDCVFDRFDITLFVETNGAQANIYNNSFIAGSGVDIGIELDDGDNWNIYHNNFTGTYTEGLYSSAIRFDTNSVGNSFWGNIFNDDKGFDFQDPAQDSQDFCVNGYGNFYNGSVRVDANDEGVPPTDCGPSPGPNGAIYVNESLTESIINWGGNATYVPDFGTGVRNANSTVYLLTNNTLTSYYTTFGALTTRSNVYFDCQGFTLSPDTPGDNSQLGLRVYDTNVNVHDCIFDGFDKTIFVETNGAQANIYNNTFLAGAGSQIGIELDDGDNWNIYHNNFTGTYDDVLYASAIYFDWSSASNSFWGNIFNNNKGFYFQGGSEDIQSFCVNGYGNYYNASVPFPTSSGGFVVEDCGPTPNANITINASITESAFTFSTASNATPIYRSVKEAYYNIWQNKTIVLESGVNSSVTAETLQDGVIVDCQGNLINTTIDAIYINGEDRNGVQNCLIETSGNSNPAIYLNAVLDSELINNTITTSGTSSYGIYLVGATDRTLIKNPNIIASSTYEIYDTTGGSYENYLVFNNSFGEINWSKIDLDVNDDLQVDSTVYLQDNLIGLSDLSGFTNINSSAKITFYGLDDVTHYLYKNGVRCDDSDACNITLDSGGIVVANVASFSNYSTVEFDSLPYWSNNQTSIVSTYSNETLSYFNITWEDDIEIDTVYFESNYSGTATNYSMNNITSLVYNYSAILPAGTHYWKSFANDSANQWNETDSWNFTIAQSSDNCDVGFSESSPIAYPSAFRVFTNCTSDFALYRNGTLITNNSNQELAAGSYNFTVIRNDSSNYSNYYDEETFVVLSVSGFTFQINTTESPQTFSFYANDANLTAWWNATNYTTHVGTGLISHSIATAGIYNITLTGNASRISYYGAGSGTPSLLIDILNNLSIVSGINSTYQMFRGASNITNFTEEHWLDDISSSVTNMGSMFNGANNFNQNLSGWNTSSVTNMRAMFANANIFNQDIKDWDTSNVENMKEMFFLANAFNQNLSGWNTSSVTDMEQMFIWANSFNQDIGSWDTSNVTDMGYMFANAHIFNQDIGGWDISNVADMGHMLYDAYAFNQNLSDWNVSGVTDLVGLLNNTNVSITNYDSLLIGWNGLSNLSEGEIFGVGGLEYCLGETARQNISDVYNWTFSGDSRNCGDEYPYWSDNQTNIVSTYSNSTLSYFNITWEDETNVSTVYFESNYSGTATNYSMNNITSLVYNYSAILPAGSYYWKSYANDSANQWNESDSWTFVVLQASTSINLTVNGSKENYTVASGDNLTVNCSLVSGPGPIYLYNNGVLINNGSNNISNLTIFTSVGTYNLTCSHGSSQNYSASSESYFVTVPAPDGGDDDGGSGGGGGSSGGSGGGTPTPVITCSSNSECGEQELTKERYCEENMIYREYSVPVCVNPGEASSFCNEETVEKLVEECSYSCEDGNCIEEPKPGKLPLFGGAIALAPDSNYWWLLLLLLLIIIPILWYIKRRLEHSRLDPLERKVRKRLMKGKTLDEIKEELLGDQWSEEDFKTVIWRIKAANKLIDYYPGTRKSEKGIFGYKFHYPLTWRTLKQLKKYVYMKSKERLMEEHILLDLVQAGWNENLIREFVSAHYEPPVSLNTTNFIYSR
jgi:surface protein